MVATSQSLARRYAAFKGFKRAPTQFNIDILPQYYNEKGQVVCYPGSVFEGTVRLLLAEPLDVQHLKVTFKATGRQLFWSGTTITQYGNLERINYDAMGWGKSKNDGRLFAVRTVLWGFQTNEDGPWPTLEAGEHNFPFVCQLPLVNYPPSFDHHFIATTFMLNASLERPGQESFHSSPRKIQFQPILETSLVKPLGTYAEEVKISNAVHAFVSLPSLAYNIFEHQKIPVRLSIRSGRQQTERAESFYVLHIYLKRYMTIVHDSFSRTEAVTVSYVDERVAAGDDVTVHLRLPPDQTVTLDYSNRFTLYYRVGISVKTRHGPLITKKKLLSIPVTFGTLPAGARAPADLTKFSDDRVMNDTSLQTKPKFLRPIRCENELPAYDLLRPPSYSTAMSSAVFP
ncbi:hypothetical protein EC973_008508 [Apophysomyces ossiformis]|uniref:Arrestin-like N-terminal domain-containing protein n=1 Tax=Apophysomyces ossiformis TaxID=679940 RepID=A0A8H7BTE2_9FUNG|nr:hypothetical protein EC973_008508 [Apophysomyces ossiformis]